MRQSQKQEKFWEKASLEFKSKVSGKDDPEKSQYQTHIPKHVARHMDLKRGDSLVWDVKDGKVEIKKKEV